jgi:hypothetical protein
VNFLIFKSSLTRKSPMANVTASSKITIAKSIFALALLANVTIAAHAQPDVDDDFDNQDKPWQENTVQLPPPPAFDQLLPFYVSATATQSFALDPKSLSVGSDGVVRYTLVSTSEAGTKNISYEGIRCQTRERKSYAFGHSDGSWVRAHNSKWEPIYSNGANSQHAALANEYFCDAGAVLGTTDTILRKLRQDAGPKRR